eukprot:TRINITY_DN12544_c0_g1_i1.p1 TRINITY_DN12544_c0_g1~~TRINITY_DN12544_c0_g1_i1.p1  ORF type:complete len:509 (+),score=150.73 TRINITY_DN12544_c0_g1_i1:102-1529(+)
MSARGGHVWGPDHSGAPWRQGGPGSGRTPQSGSMRGRGGIAHPFPNMPANVPAGPHGGGRQPYHSMQEAQTPPSASSDHHTRLYQRGRRPEEYAPQGGPWGQPAMQPEGPPRSPRREDEQRQRLARERSVKDRVLRELAEKHLKTAPEGMLCAAVPFMLLVEDAFWDYLDNYSPMENQEYALLPSYQTDLLKGFTKDILVTCAQLRMAKPDIKQLVPDVQIGGTDAARDEPNKHNAAARLHNQLCEWKRTVPTAGAVILTPDFEKVLLVRNALPGALWGFPKGKCERSNPNDPSLQFESAAATAIREVREQTGVDISDKLGQAEVVEHRITRRSQQRACVTLFVVVLPETEKQPQHQGERSRIDSVEWHSWARLLDAQSGRCEQGDLSVVVRYVPDVSRGIDRLREHFRGAPGLDWQRRRAQFQMDLIGRYPEAREALSAAAPAAADQDKDVEHRLRRKQELQQLILRRFGPAQP